MNTSPENLHKNTNEVVPPTEMVSSTPEAVEFVEKFKHTQEDLRFMFGINVENENDLSSPELKNKFYTKVIEDLTSGKPFALDYMFEEKLLSKEDMKERGIQTYKQQAVEILAKIKGPLGRRMKDLIINTGILTSEEADRASITS